MTNTDKLTNDDRVLSFEEHLIIFSEEIMQVFPIFNGSLYHNFMIYIGLKQIMSMGKYHID